MVGNALYATLSIFPEGARYGLLMLSRFIVGVSAGEQQKSAFPIILLWPYAYHY